MVPYRHSPVALQAGEFTQWGSRPPVFLSEELLVTAAWTEPDSRTGSLRGQPRRADAPRWPVEARGCHAALLRAGRGADDRLRSFMRPGHWLSALVALAALDCRNPSSCCADLVTSGQFLT